MKRKLLSVLLSLLMVLVCIPLGAVGVSAASEGTTGDCTWTLDGTHLTISGNGEMGNYTYVANFNGGVGTTAPWGWNITSVTIEDGVTTIGDYAFIGCHSLTSVTIGDSVTSIGDEAFSNTSLQSVTIPDGVITIGYAAFSCSALTSVTIPDTITTIGRSMFNYCSSLTSVVIPYGVTAIENGAFFYCTSLTSVTIPCSVTSVGDGAFENCSTLTDVDYSGSEEDRANIAIGSDNDSLLSATWHYSKGVENGLLYEIADGEVTITGYTEDLPADVVIPDTIENYPVTTIGDSAFFDCTILEHITIPNSVVNLVGGDHFAVCTNLKTVALGDGLERMSFCMFAGCTSLSAINIPESVTAIAGDAFYNTNLSEINIPASVSYIGFNAFYKCDSLTTVYYAGTEEDRANITIEEANAPLWNAAWHYSDGTVSAPVRGLLYEINNGEVTITGYTEDVPEHVVVPATIEGYPVKAIGDGAFFGVGEDYHIVSIVVSEGVETIGRSAFGRDMTNSLVSVKLPDTVTSIGEGAFLHSSVREVNIPNGLKTIPAGAFAYSSITSIIIPYGVTTIGEEAFSGCALTSVEISESVTTIGDYAFERCGKLTSVVLPNGIETIPRYSFSECYALTSIVIPDSVKTIEEGAFCDASLVEIVIPDSVTVIEEYAFVSCDNLTAVTLSKDLERIEESAFAGCSSLSDVYYGKGEGDRANITIDEKNDPLLNATWHYNCINPKDCYSNEVQHSVMDTENGNGLAFKFELNASVGVKDKNKLDFTTATINYLGQTCKLVGVGAVITNQEDTILELGNVNGKTVIDIPAVYLMDWELDSCAFAARIINIPNCALERVIYARPYYVIELDGQQIVVYGDIDSASCANYM